MGQNSVAQGWLVDRIQSMKNHFPTPPLSTLGSGSCKSFGKTEKWSFIKKKKTTEEM